MKAEKQRNQARDYWAAQSLKWESGAYYRDAGLRGEKGILESIASCIRGDSVYQRMQAAAEFLRPHLTDAHVLDIGCGSGRFCRSLADLGARRVTGIDISAPSIEYAKSHYAADNIEFMVCDPCVPGTDLPPCTIATALGVVEYLDPDQLQSLFENLNADHILWHCVQRPTSFRRRIRHTLRQPYLWLKGVPPVHFYGLDDLRKLAGAKDFGQLKYVIGDYFITDI
jgi:SAM-dependent methyltransferase